MRLKVIKQLLCTNIIYTSQASTLSKYRIKQAKYPSQNIHIARKFILSYLAVGILYAVIFGLHSATLPLTTKPHLFSNLVSVFLLYIFSQGFLAFYHVFYESKDLQSYRSYAFKESEVLLGKGIAVVLTTFVGIFPIIVYFVALQFQLRQFILLAIPIVLLSLTLLFSSLFFLILIGVHFITKTTIFRQHQKIASNLLLALASILAFGAMTIISATTDDNVLLATSIFSPIDVFHHFSLHPLSLSSLLGIGSWFLFDVFLFIIIQKKVLPEFYESAVTTTRTVRKKKKKQNLSLTESKSFPRFVWSYQLSLLGDGSVLLQTILLSSLTPYLFFFPLLMNVLRNDLDLSYFLSPRFGLPLMFIIFLITFINAGTNLTSIGLSLERENYAYLKVLPFDLNHYVQLKFWSLYVIQSSFPLTLMILFLLLLGSPFSTILILGGTWLLTYLVWSAWNYCQDKRLMVTNWSNVTELFNRKNRMIHALVSIAVFIILLGLIGVLYFIVDYLPPLFGYLFTGLTFLAVACSSFFLTRHYLRTLQTLIEEE